MERVSMIKRLMVAILAAFTFTALVGSPAQATVVWDQPQDTIVWDSANFAQPVSMKNDPCTGDRICMYECELAWICQATSGLSHPYPSTCTSLTNYPDRNIQSIKNNSARGYFVFATSNCSGSQWSQIYPWSSGNMNWEWEGRQITSIRWAYGG